MTGWGLSGLSWAGTPWQCPASCSRLIHAARSLGWPRRQAGLWI